VARLADEIGVSRRTVACVIAWLQARGYLGTVETGSTPLFRTDVRYGMAAAGEIQTGAAGVAEQLQAKAKPRAAEPAELERVTSNAQERIAAA
jgi:hypothetical protein